MAFGIHTMFVDQYAKTVLANATAATEVEARSGEVIGRVPFRYVRDETKTLKIDLGKSGIAKYIFKFYNSGLGYESVTKKLNDEISRSHLYQNEVSVLLVEL